MNYNSQNTLFSSPQVPMAKYECSPIITVEKYHILNRRLVCDGVESGVKNINNLENFGNQGTPIFKIPFEEIGNNQSAPNKIKIPITINDIPKENCFYPLKFNLPLPSTATDSWHNILASLKKIEKKSAVTNIFVHDNKSYLFLKKKTKRLNVKKSPEKKFKLDEIVVNGKKIKFLLDLKEDDESEEEQADSLLVTLPKLLYENNFKRLNPNSKSKEERVINSPLKKEFLKGINLLISNYKFKRIFKKILTSKDYNNKTFSSTDPCLLYFEGLNSFKSAYKNLQDEFLARTRKRIDKTLLSKVEESIDYLNKLLEILLKTAKDHSKEKVKSRRRKIIYYCESYDCKICDRRFETGQGLGGHMSRMHPNCSEQYLIKMKVRKSRAHERQILYKAKKELLSRYYYDYDMLKSDYNSKKMIWKVLSAHKAEYRTILQEFKKQFKNIK